MIRLQDYTEEERLPLLSNMEYYSHIMWKKTRFLRQLHTNLISEFGDKYKQELWIVLTFSSKAVRYDTQGFRISLKHNDYLAATRYYKGKSVDYKVTRNKMRELLERMDNAGYITFMVGFKTKSVSCISAVKLDKLIDLIDKNKAVRLATPRPNKDLRIIEVVDIEKTKITKRVNSKGDLVKHKDIVFKDTRNIDGVKERRDPLFKYNKIIEASFVQIDGQVDNSIIYKRRYEDEVFLCGRYYTLGNFQVRGSELRNTIVIDDEPTCEIDYKNAQPRMIAELKGITLPEDFDTYVIDGLDRDFAKSLLFPILFSDSRGGAKTSITAKLKERPDVKLTSEEIVSKFETHNSFMKDSFYNKVLYRILQNKDSTMAETIIDQFTEEGVVVLCYHDSFVIASKYKGLLLSRMRQAWKTVMGSTNCCLPVIEFEN